MADNKELYSKASEYYVENKSVNSNIDHNRFERSKIREQKYNEEWLKNKVNLNDIIDQFTPDFKAYENGVKYIFEGSKYTIKADMASGYLRIMENSTCRYLKLNGTYGNNNETHFKIKRREEM